MTVMWGLMLGLVAGVMTGSFSLPMKKTTRWSWEATWLVWAITALIVLPWGISRLTVPDLLAVYRNCEVGALLMVFLFGVGWGMGAVLFGQSIAMIGMSLAFAISIGLTAALGALIPMATEPSVFLTLGGATAAAGIALMMAAVGVCCVAGLRKDAQIKQQAVQPQEAEGVSRSRLLCGLVICILSGLFNPMLNFAFNFGKQIEEVAVRAGASVYSAPDAIWTVTLLGGFVTNLVYCGYLLSRNGTWADYRKSKTASHWPLSMLMAVIWLSSIFLYGRAAVMMGGLGRSAGWAIYMGCCIMASNVWGILTGEWREGKGKPLRTMYAGLGLLLASIAVVGLGNWLSTKP